MLKLRNRITIRIPDRLAVIAAVTLTVTAGGGVLGERFMNDAALGVDATAKPVQTEVVDPTSDDSARQTGLASRLLLFRRG